MNILNILSKMLPEPPFSQLEVSCQGKVLLWHGEFFREPDASSCAAVWDSGYLVFYCCALLSKVRFCHE